MGDYHKRSADAAGLDGGSYQKNPRLTDPLSILEPAVRDKLNELFERGLVAPDELDNKALRELAEFSSSAGLEILDQYERTGLVNVRNKAGYLCGVMTRFRRQKGPRLDADVQRQLDTLFRTSKISSSDLDERCYDALANLPPPVAIRALEKFGERDLSEVRNMSAFFMSHIKLANNETIDGPGAFRGGPGPALAPRGPPKQLPPPVMPEPVAMPQVLLDTGTGQLIPLTTALPLQPMILGKQHRGVEQAMMGVRVDEFHNLSTFAPYVHPAPALKLQTMWDSGVRLVALLDDRAWEVLSDLEAPEGIALVSEVGDSMAKGENIRNVNAFFMAAAKKYIDSGGRRPQAQHQPQQPQHHSNPYDPYDQHTAAHHQGYKQSHQGRPGRELRDSRDRERDRDRERERERDGHGGGHSGPRAPGSLRDVPSAVRNKIMDVMHQHRGLLNESHFDEGVISAFNRLPEWAALGVLKELAGNDLTQVRNLPAYIMGICKRHKDKLRQ